MSEEAYRLHTPAHARSEGARTQREAITQEAARRAAAFEQAPSVDAAVDAIVALQMYLRGEARKD